ncbi:carbohydrate ABC transporter permease [Paenibacillus thalictri]|uniref:Carbohydrate ABC transporter permease n=1 Tax=Paenibacillus thalictri TaxID=2527873 RepID=A0A4Q9DRR4_9BACL|nr:carbohydrate ABC transporter permease [Paenibacillus thalictri]TBL79494.1 carbohydrate ABC transporter permease [Paenibacillus thalictri]
MNWRLQKTLHYTLLALLAAAILYPLYFTFASAFMTPQEVSSYPPPLVPKGLYWGNIADTLNTVPIVKFLLNSLITSVSITAGQLVFSSMAAYAFAILRFPGKGLLFIMFLSTMMIPWEITIIPNYLTIRAWGWMDSYQGLTVPFMASAFGIFLLRQSFLQLPAELFDAAKIDGCGIFRCYLRLVLPLSRPALATLCIYGYLHAWNMYLWPLLITNSDMMRTVQIGISMLQWEESQSWNLVLAGVTIVLIPSLLLLVVGIRQLVQGITAGALKG